MFIPNTQSRHSFRSSRMAVPQIEPCSAQKVRTSRLLIQSVLLAAILVSLFQARVLAQREQAQKGPLYGQFTIKPFKVVGNIYSVGLSNNTSWLITTPQGHFLLDPTIAEGPPEIRKNIEQLGFKVTDIKIILQSHAHSDHVAGVPAMKQMTGAKVVAMAEDVRILEDGGKSDYRGDGRQTFTPIHPDQVIHDGEKVQLGGVTMVAHLTPGHTPGCTTWSTVAEENGKKYNVLFNCSVRMNPRQALIGNEKYPGLADDFARAFKTLKSLPCDMMLASHASMFDMAEKIQRMGQNPGSNPFIDPAFCRSFIALYEKAYTDELAKERAGGGVYTPSPDDPTQKESQLPCPNDGRTCYGARPRRAGA